MKFSDVRLCFIFIQLLTGSVNAATIAGPFTYADNGHQYYLLSPSGWVNSETEAHSIGGHLVTINDLAENQWVFDTFAPLVNSLRPPSSDDIPSLWIGLSDAAVEGNHIWANGEPFLFAHWDIGQPNNSGGDQDYVTMRARGSNLRPEYPGFWNDYVDLAPRNEFGVVEVVPEPSGIVLAGIGSAFLAVRKRSHRTRYDRR